MNTKTTGRSATVCLAVLFLFFTLSGAASQAVKPSPKDKCPVCGMFVAEYGGFLAEVVFKDGFRAFFDGPKDMFRYSFQPEKYQPGRSRADIAAVYVTDYYSMEMIDGTKAFYISGSDVRGPMGNELIPVGREAEAKTFMADHKGKALLKFSEVSLDIVNGLD